MTTITDQLAAEWRETQKTAAVKWIYPELQAMWMILATPNYEDGEPVLGEKDIVQLQALAINLRDKLREEKGL